MFRSYYFSCNKYIQDDNELEIIIHSPLKYIEEKKNKSPYIPCPSYMNGEEGRNFIRKCGCDFGWDWGPCVISMGIYKPVYLITSETFIKNVKVFQTFNWKEKKVNLKFKVKLFSIIDTEGLLSIEFNQQTFDSKAKCFKGDNELDYSIEVENPQLWYPNGYGEQYLYHSKVTFTSNDVSVKHLKFGIREVKLDTSKDEYGNRFCLLINNIAIMCKGANYIPYDTYHIFDKNKIDNILKSTIDSNMNMLRIWGGGIYEDDYFYEKCDELG